MYKFKAPSLTHLELQYSYNMHFGDWKLEITHFMYSYLQPRVPRGIHSTQIVKAVSCWNHLANLRNCSIKCGQICRLLKRVHVVINYIIQVYVSRPKILMVNTLL